MIKINNTILLALVVAMSFSFSAHAQGKRSPARIVGIWKGEVQLLHHNTRYKEPNYYHVGMMAMSVDSYGNVIGRIDNDCAFEGSTSGFGRDAPAKIKLKLRRCPDPEFNKRFDARLSSTGELMMQWQMMDDTFPIIVRVNGMLEIKK